MSVNNFDVLKRMGEQNLDVRLAPLENVVRVQMTKRGTQVTIGCLGDLVAAFAQGRFTGGLILADTRQFEEVKRHLEHEAQPHDETSAPPVTCEYCSTPHPLNDDGTRCRFPKPYAPEPDSEPLPKASQDYSRMPPEVAERHFATRMEKLKGDILSLPTVEKIRLAAEGLASGWSTPMVESVLSLALTEVRRRSA